MVWLKAVVFIYAAFFNFNNMDNKKEYYAKCCEIIDRLAERYLKPLNDDLTDGIKDEDIEQDLFYNHD